MSADNALSGLAPDRRLLIFRVGELRCGVDIRDVQGVNRNTDVTRVPTAEADVRGVVNLRGTILTVLDLAVRLGLDTTQATEDCKNVVVRAGPELVGLLVDDVDDIVGIDASILQPTPPHLPERLLRYADGLLPLEDGVAVVLDVEKLAS